MTRSSTPKLCNPKYWKQIVRQIVLSTDVYGKTICNSQNVSMDTAQIPMDKWIDKL